MALKKLLLAAGALACIPASASAADLIDNGGFELPGVDNACCSTVPPSALPGWDVLTGNVNVVIGTFGSSAGNLAFQGSQYLDLVGQGGVGSLSQTFNTVAGQAYQLSFAYSHNLFSNLSSAAASFSVGNLAGTVTHSGGSNADLGWLTFTDTFVAGGATSTLTFINTAGGANEGIFLDAVSVNEVVVNATRAVPEPATWAMLLIGFAAAGSALRRPKRERRLSASLA